MSIFGLHICMDEINAFVAIVVGLKCFARWRRMKVAATTTTEPRHKQPMFFWR